MDNAFMQQLKLSFMDKKSQELGLDTEFLHCLMELAENNLSILKDIWKSVQAKYEYVRMNLLFDIEMTFTENEVSVNYNEHEFHTPVEKFNKLIVNILDLFEVIYPLGSVVNLKTEYLNRLTNDTEIEEATFVITSRYVYTDEVKTYFQYGGIPYPVGTLGGNQVFYFTSDLIQEVLASGYADEREDAYIYMMKKELLLDKDYISIGYVSEEERKNLESKLRENSNGQ